MWFLKAVTFITLWVLLSFFWVRVGQSQVRSCPNYGQIETWVKAYPTLKSWYHFYQNQQKCESNESDFFKTLASSEPLSIKLNEARVSFEQFYVPVYNALSVDWGKAGEEESQKIQSDLSSIDQSLKKAMGKMNTADQDYFRAMVLMNLPSEFVMLDVLKNAGPASFGAHPPTRIRSEGIDPKLSPAFFNTPMLRAPSSLFLSLS